MPLGGNSRHHQTYTNEESTIRLYGYKTSLTRSLIVLALSFFTCGLFRLLLHWKPKLHLYFKATRCCFEDADLVYVVDDHNVSDICKVNRKSASDKEPVVVAVENGMLMELHEIRWFTYRKMKYTWVDDDWVTTNQVYNKTTVDDILASVNLGGLTDNDVELRRSYFGTNEMQIDLTSIPRIIVREIASPFYIFQAFSVTVWYIDEYVWYATLIIFMTFCTITVTIFQTREQEKRIRSMVQTEDTVVTVLRNKQKRVIPTSEVVPGDILVIPADGGVFHCDCLMLSGAAIVNESILTGESIPITKVPLTSDGHEETFSIESHRKNIIFCGSQVLQTRVAKGQEPKALVLRTSFSTMKGQLVRSIMYPKPVDFRFTKDLFRLVGVLAIVAFFGFIYTAIVLFYRGSDLFRILIRALDLVTIVVPPALPAVMSVGILYSTRRLKKNNIFCISPSTINTCGLIDVVCFDKTGTLTEDGLNFHAVRRVDANSVVFGDEETTMERDEQHQKMFEAMATCHSLTRMNGELSGDPLDEILFHQTCFSFEDDAVDEEHGEDCDVDSNGSDSSLRPTVLHSPDDVYGDVIVHRQFSFSSALQRMSVLVASSRKPNVITAYVKGSPEMIGNLCVEESVPEHFHEVIEEYTQHGFRLIAIASKSFDSSDVKVQAVTRNVVEKDLTLIGLVILENKLKSVTSEVIDRLNKARIRSVMVTGDNLLTALSVARECTIIKPNKKTFLVEHRPGQFDLNGKTLITITERIEGVSSTSPKSSPSSSDLSKLCRSDAQFAISGMTYAVICHEYPDLVQQLVCVCDVFARMAPDQKQMLVEQLQHASCTVAMCGDGANDCSALKSAHAGISLSDSEASIAAPFTSKVADIRCVPTIISEGRAALVTSFGSFLCMTSYSLTQFISILLLYWISGSYTQKQFLFIDLAIVTVLSCLFAHTAPYAKLANRPPPSRILSFHTLSGLFVHLTIGGLAQLLVFTTITLQPWFLPYQPPESHSNEDRRSMQGTAIFFVSTFHYIMIYVVFAKGPPFRSSVLTNVPFCLAASGLYLVCILILIWPIEFVLIQLECVMLPSLVFRLFILGVALIASTVSLTYSRVHDRLVQAIVDRLPSTSILEKTAISVCQESICFGRTKFFYFRNDCPSGDIPTIGCAVKNKCSNFKIDGKTLGCHEMLPPGSGPACCLPSICKKSGFKAYTLQVDVGVIRLSKDVKCGKYEEIDTVVVWPGALKNFTATEVCCISILSMLVSGSEIMRPEVDPTSLTYTKCSKQTDCPKGQMCDAALDGYKRPYPDKYCFSGKFLIDEVTTVDDLVGCDTDDDCRSLAGHQCVDHKHFPFTFNKQIRNGICLKFTCPGGKPSVGKCEDGDTCPQAWQKCVKSRLNLNHKHCCDLIPPKCPGFGFLREDERMKCAPSNPMCDDPEHGICYNGGCCPSASLTQPSRTLLKFEDAVKTVRVDQTYFKDEKGNMALLGDTSNYYGDLVISGLCENMNCPEDEVCAQVGHLGEPNLVCFTNPFLLLKPLTSTSQSPPELAVAGGVRIKEVCPSTWLSLLLAIILSTLVNS